MIFRLSQKLCTKIKAGPLREMPLDDNPYADWSCHLFTTNRIQYVILNNTKSLYSCLMHGRGITNDSVFIDRALSCIREFMGYDGQSFAYERFIAPASGTATFAKSLNRSVTGSMNELIDHATCLIDGKLSLFDVSVKLNELLLSALASEASRGYGRPNEAFRLLGGALDVIEGGDG